MRPTASSTARRPSTPTRARPPGTTSFRSWRGTRPDRTGLAFGQVPADDHHDHERHGQEYPARQRPVPGIEHPAQDAADRVERTRHQACDPVPDRTEESVHRVIVAVVVNDTAVLGSVQLRAATRAPPLRGSTTTTRPSRSVSAEAAMKAASRRVIPAIESVKARIVEPAPDRHAPIAPADRAASIIRGSSG